MPQPTTTQVHIDAPLTDISVAYMQSEENFVSSRAFPIVPVQKKSDLYFTYTKNDWFRDEAQERAGGTESAGSGYGLSTGNYSCKVYAFHKDVDDQTRENADNPLDQDRDATLFVSQRLRLRQEIQWATNFFTTGKWATDRTPSNLWSNYNTSDPISDMRLARATILGVTGYLPNKLILGYNVYEYLINHPDMVDRVKYGGEKVVTKQALAAIFEVEEIMVSAAIKATNAEGGTEAYSFISGDNALLCYSAKAPGILTPSAGYTFAWKGVSGGLGKTVGVKKFRMEHLEADRVEGQTAFDHKLIAADLGYFFSQPV